MSSIWISGKQRIQGEISIQGCKNAVLPMMAAALLTEEEVLIQGCPDILDVRSMKRILQQIGCKAEWEASALRISKGCSASSVLPEEDMQKLRASGLLMGAIAATGRKVVLPRTGGCVIGKRPMDLHVYALRTLGYLVTEKTNAIIVEKCALTQAADIYLRYPSVGATENAILASVLLEGETVIYGAAREPEIEDLVNMLNGMGARIRGAGHECIRIQGVKSLHGVQYEVMPDRITAGTYLIAAAATSGELEIRNVCAEHLTSVIRVLRTMGCRIETEKNRICIRTSEVQVPVQIRTGPYPQFPTDLQPVMMACLVTVKGMSLIRETVFESRWATAEELQKMGALIQVEHTRAVIYGNELHAARVHAPDLRGGAALAVAAMNAIGTTWIGNAEWIQRGYEDIVRDLKKMNVRCSWN